MQVSSVIEQENGSLTFTGELSPSEVEVVVSFGLNMLYAQGLLRQLAPSVDASMHEGNEDNLQ